jgi:peroxiredoxin Q/BCP
MCTRQLVKLQARLGEIVSEGGAVFAVSIDTPEQAKAAARQYHLTFPLLSDPGMEVIGQYGMKGEGMKMADLGYVVVDRAGRVQTRRFDREFGDHVEQILREIRRAKA